MNIRELCVLCATALAAVPVTARADPCGDFLENFYSASESEFDITSAAFLAEKADEIQKTFNVRDGAHVNKFVVNVMHHMKKKFEAESIHLTIYEGMWEELKEYRTEEAMTRELREYTGEPPPRFTRIFLSLGAVQHACNTQYIEAMKIYCEGDR